MSQEHFLNFGSLYTRFQPSLNMGFDAYIPYSAEILGGLLLKLIYIVEML